MTKRKTRTKRTALMTFVRRTMRKTFRPINLHPSLSETPSFHIQSSEWQKLLPPKQIRPNSSSVNKAAKTSRLEPVKHRHMVHPQGQRNGWNNTDWFLLQNKRSYLPGQPGMSCPSNWNRFIQNPNPFCWFQDPHLSIIPVAKLFFSRWENTSFRSTQLQASGISKYIFQKWNATEVDKPEVSGKTCNRLRRFLENWTLEGQLICTWLPAFALHPGAMVT